MTHPAHPPVPPGYLQDSKGRLVPEHQIRPIDKLEDQLVHKLLGYAQELSAQVARFVGHCEDDVEAFNALISEQYKAKPRGGAKGGMTFTSFDGCLQVRFIAAETIEFGPGLQVAKSLIDECIAEWSHGASAAIVTLVQSAFETDKAGKLSIDKILALRRTDIDDDRWRRAMQAIDEAKRTLPAKIYPVFRCRRSPQDGWKQITIDPASVAGNPVTGDAP